MTGVLNVDDVNQLVELVFLNLTGNPDLEFPPDATCDDFDVCREDTCDISLCD